MVVVPKQNDKICVDLTKLNESVKRTNFALQNIEKSLGLLAGANILPNLTQKRVFGRSNSPMTKFITYFGWFAFHRLPF